VAWIAGILTVSVLIFSGTGLTFLYDLTQACSLIAVHSKAAILIRTTFPYFYANSIVTHILPFTGLSRRNTTSLTPAFYAPFILVTALLVYADFDFYTYSINAGPLFTCIPSVALVVVFACISTDLISTVKI